MSLGLGQKRNLSPRRPSFWAKNRFGARGEGHFTPKTGFRSAATLILGQKSIWGLRRGSFHGVCVGAYCIRPHLTAPWGRMNMSGARPCRDVCGANDSRAGYMWGECNSPLHVSTPQRAARPQHINIYSSGRVMSGLPSPPGFFGSLGCLGSLGSFGSLGCLGSLGTDGLRGARFFWAADCFQAASNSAAR